jgi:hypothetical protein
MVLSRHAAVAVVLSKPEKPTLEAWRDHGRPFFLKVGGNNSRNFRTLERQWRSRILEFSLAETRERLSKSLFSDSFRNASGADPWGNEGRTRSEVRYGLRLDPDLQRAFSVETGLPQELHPQ